MLYPGGLFYLKVTRHEVTLIERAVDFFSDLQLLLHLLYPPKIEWKIKISNRDVTFLSNALQHIDTSAYQQGME